jgi:hypothetical protein
MKELQESELWTKLEEAQAIFTFTAPSPMPEFYFPKTRRYGPTVSVRTEPKIGRNAPCSCGSGVKSKKCQCTKK